MGLLKLISAGLRRIKYYIIVNVIAFIAGGIIGSMSWGNLGEQLYNELKKTAGFISPTNPLQVFTYILGHNMFIAYVLGYVLGILIATPLLVMVINGIGISSVVAYFSAKSHIPVPLVVLALLPHGSFEVPALILASSVGIDFGVSTWKRLLKKIPKEEYHSRLKEEGAILILTVILLVVAATIETSLIVLGSMIAKNIGNGTIIPSKWS